MNNKPISIIAGTVLGSLIATTSYAYPPSESCLEARVDFLKVIDVIQRCKNFIPDGEWICSEPLRPGVTEMKKDCLAIARYMCRSEEFPDDPGGYCAPNTLEPVLCPSVAGTWRISLDLNCDGKVDVTRTNIYHDDFTWNGVGFPNGGPWTQNLCSIEMSDSFFNPPLIWEAELKNDGNTLSGTYSGVFNGCWSATRVPPLGFDAPADVEEDGGAYYNNGIIEE